MCPMTPGDPGQPPPGARQGRPPAGPGAQPSAASTGHRCVELVVAGAAGRMGGRLVALARRGARPPGGRGLRAARHPALGRDAGEVAGAGHLGVPVAADPAGLLERGRVLVEFTAPGPTLEHVRVAAARGAAAVVGTTGLSPAEVEEVGRLARQSLSSSPPTWRRGEPGLPGPGDDGPGPGGRLRRGDHRDPPPDEEGRPQRDSRQDGRGGRRGARARTSGPRGLRAPRAGRGADPRRRSASTPSEAATSSASTPWPSSPTGSGWS